MTHLDGPWKSGQFEGLFTDPLAGSNRCQNPLIAHDPDSAHQAAQEIQGTTRLQANQVGGALGHGRIQPHAA